MIKKREIIFVTVLIILNAVLIFLKNPYIKEGNYTYCKGEIISVDNAHLYQFGIIKQGDQIIEIKILSGKYKGNVYESDNQLIGKMDLDKYFQKGDIAYVEIMSNGKQEFAHAVDHYKTNYIMILFLVFAVILIFYSGWTGLKSLLSFSTTLLVIWKILLPLFLEGINPLFISFIIITVLTAIIVYLVAGFTKKGNVSFLGSVAGIIITIIISEIFQGPFKINGSVMPFSETLLYSGFSNLNLNKLFLASIFIASSGAVMDISMDISASMNEILIKKPDISRKELIKSGFNVGKAVIGTMTTTLLLAYSGSYLTLLMSFMAQGVDTSAMINISYISSEILKTIVGSFGLILTAPLTAIIGGFIYKKRER